MESAAESREEKKGRRGRKRSGSFLLFLIKDFSLIRLAPLAFLSATSVCVDPLNLGLKGSNLIFLPLCTN